MPPTIDELDVTVRAFYEGRGDQQKTAQAALNQFKEDPDAWLMVDDILSRATYDQTKFLGLQVLDHVIMTRWKVLPREQCQGMEKNCPASMDSRPPGLLTWTPRNPQLHRLVHPTVLGFRRNPQVTADSP
jgi:hypothetical protein